MATSSPIRIDSDVHASAEITASLMSRSTAQQVTYWARLGRELETSRSISNAAIAEVLGGAASYDSLNAREQAVVRVNWTEVMTSRRESLDLAEDFAAEGRSYVELDDNGKVARRGGRRGAH